MHFGVLHEINDPDAWSKAVEVSENPSDMNLHVFVEALDKSRGLCVWEAPSADALQRFLDQAFGHAAVNHVFEAHVFHFEPLAT